MTAQQSIRADGLVRPHFAKRWAETAAAKLGRMDSVGGQFNPHLDGAERPYVDLALGVIKGVMGARMDSAAMAVVQKGLVYVDGKQFGRADAGETIFAAQALRAIDPQNYQTLIPPLKARTFIPTSVKAGIDPGNETYLYRRYTRTGMARFISNGSANDLPRANAFVTEVSQRAYPIGVQIEYNYFELLAVGAALSNGQSVDLVGENMRAALEAIEKKLDIIAAFGTATPPTGFALEVDVDLGLTGLLNNTSETQYTLATGAAGGTAWSTKTPDEVLADLNGIVGSQEATTYEVHVPDTIVVPISQMQTQLTRRMSDVSDTTILEFFQKTRREMGKPVEVLQWMYMAGAGTAGADLMLAFKRDPRMFEHVLLLDATPLAPSTVGITTVQPVIAKTASVIVRYPLSISSASGC